MERLYPLQTPTVETPDPLADKDLSGLNLPDAENPVQRSFKVAINQEPDHTAEVLKTSNALGQPPEVVDANFESAKKAATLPPPSYFEQIVSNNPRTSAFLSDPRKMAVAKDTIPTLTAMEDAARLAIHRLNPVNLPIKPEDIQKAAVDLGAGWKSGRLNVREAEVGWHRLLETIQTGQESSFGESDLAAIKEEQAGAGADPTGFRPFYFTGQQLPNFALMAERGTKRAAQFGLIGAGGAALMSLATGPGAPAVGTVSIPAATLAGLGLGGRAGVAEASAMLEGGLAYEEFRGLKDKNGNPVPPRLAASLALGVGIVNAGLEYASAAALLRTIPGGQKVLGWLADKKVFPKLTPGLAVKEAAKRYLESIGTEVVTEMAQEASTIAGGDAAKLLSGQPFDPVPTADRVARVLAVVSPTAQATALMGFPGSMLHVATDIRSIERAGEAKKVYLALQDQSSKLRQRSPDVHAEHVEAVTKGTAVENIYVDARQAQAYFQSANIDMGKVAEELGVTDQVENAVERGGDIVLPYAKWNAVLGGTEHYANLVNDVKFSEQERTIRQAVTKAVETEQLLVSQHEKAAAADLSLATGKQFVENDIATKLKASGAFDQIKNGDAVIQHTAKVFAAMVSNLPERGTRDLKSFYESMTPVEPTAETQAPDQSLQQSGRHPTEDISWSVRPDGTISVKGNPARIREIVRSNGINVVGTPKEAGLDFTSAYSNRIVSALRGDEHGVRGSRKGQIIEHEVWEGGERAGTIKGAPDPFNTFDRLPVLREILRRAALEGEVGRYWYENSGQAILNFCGGNVDLAEKFAKVLAIYSPATDVGANMTNALKAWYQWLAGKEIKAGRFGEQDRKASAVLYQNKHWEGEKTNNFFINLMRQIKPEQYADVQGITNDMWMMRMFGYPTDAPTAQAYKFVETETNRLAQELGWEPQQVQAAIWTSVKTRLENRAVKTTTDTQSVLAGDLKFAKDRKGKIVRKWMKKNAEARHRERWFNNAMNAPIEAGEIAAAKFDFADALDNYRSQVSWEARPGRTTGVLPEVNDAPLEVQREFQRAIMQAFRGEKGQDLLAEFMKLPILGEFEGTGIWQKEFAAGAQEEALVPPRHKPGKGETISLDPSTKKIISAFAAIKGALLYQEAVGWHRPFYATALRDANAVGIMIGRTALAEETEALYNSLDRELKASGLGIELDNHVGLIPSPDGIRAVVFYWPGAPQNQKFHEIVKKVAQEAIADDVAVKYFATDGDLVDNNWKEAPHGEDYFRRAIEAGFEDAVAFARTVLAPKIRAVHESFAAKYGWTNPYGVEGVGPAYQQAYQERLAANLPPPGDRGTITKVSSEVLNQGTPDNPRGFIQFTDVKTLIGLINADPSTFVHELGHLWLKNFAAFIKTDQATERHFADWKVLSDWLGIKEGQTDITRAQHEKFARGFEAYLREGVTPSLDLKESFRRFAYWLGRLYRNVSALGVELTAPVREVMNRMLATEEEIAFAKQQQGLDLIPDMKGIDPSVIHKLQALREEATGRAYDELLQKQMKELKPEARETYQRELDIATKAAEKEVDDLPEQKAIRELERALGRDPKEMAYAFLNKTLTDDERLSFRMISEMQGYSSPQMMAKKVIQTASRESEIAKRVAFAMEPHQHLMNTDKIKEEAIRVLANEKQTELLAYERALFLALVDQANNNAREVATRRADAKIEADTAKRKAHEVIANTPAKKAVSFMPYFTAERNAAVEAYEAARAGQFEKAADAKRRQMLNHALATEAFHARQNIEKWTRYLNKVRTKEMRLFKKEEHFVQVAELLRRFGIERNDYDPTKRTETLTQWSERMLDQEGVVSIAPWILDESVAGPLKELTVQHMEDYVNAIAQIQHVANHENTTYRINQGQRIDAVVGGLSLESAKYNVANPTDKVERKTGAIEKLKHLGRGYNTALLNTESIILKLGGWKDDGVWHNTLWKPAEASGNYESTMIRQYRERYDALLHKHYTAEELAALNDEDSEIIIPEWNQSVKKIRLIMMALNTGTESNRARLFETPIHGIPPGTVWNEESVLSTLQKHLTANDWRFVQGVWNMLGSLFPEMAKVHLELTGFSPNQIEPYAFRVTTSDGKQVMLDGGYFPLKADPRSSMTAEVREALDKPLYTERMPALVMATRQDHLKSRVAGAKYSIDLDQALIHKHMQEAIHDIAWRATIVDLRRIINHPDFRNTVLSFGSPEDYRALREWVGSAARGQTVEFRLADAMNEFLLDIRRRFTNAVIILNPRIVTQNLSNIFLYAKAVDGFGWKDVISGMWSKGILSYVPASLALRDRAVAIRDEVYAKSSFMRDRRDNPDYSLSETASKAFGKNERVRDFFVGLMTGSDELTSIPMWLTAYEKMKEARGEAGAIEYADRLIFRVLGGSRKYQMSGLFRGGEVTKMFGLLQGFFNAQQNRWARERGLLKQEGYIAGSPRFMGYLFAHFVVFAAMSNVMSGNIPDVDDEESIKKWLKSVVLYKFQMMPGINAAANVIYDQTTGIPSFGYKPLPQVAVIEKTIDAVVKAVKAAQGEAEPADALESASHAAAYLTGVPDFGVSMLWQIFDIANGMEPEWGDLIRRRPKGER